MKAKKSEFMMLMQVCFDLTFIKGTLFVHNCKGKYMLIYYKASHTSLKPCRIPELPQLPNSALCVKFLCWNTWACKAG